MDLSNDTEAVQAGDEQSECDNVTALELQRTKRILYFSDGTMEALSDSDDDGLDGPDKSMELDIDVNTLPLASRIRYKTYNAGVRILSAIDYVGGWLANFLGITSPKFISEHAIDSAYNNQATRRGSEEDSNFSWRQNNNNTMPAVIDMYPRNSVNNSP